MPVAWGEWLVAVLFSMLGVAPACGHAVALRSRVVPPPGAVSLVFPLECGVYVDVNGGNDIETTAHLTTLDAGIP